MESARGSFLGLEKPDPTKPSEEESEQDDEVEPVDGDETEHQQFP